MSPVDAVSFTGRSAPNIDQIYRAHDRQGNRRLGQRGTLVCSETHEVKLVAVHDKSFISSVGVLSYGPVDI